MATAAHNQFPKPGLMDRLRDAKGRLVLVAAVGTASLLGAANLVKSDSSSKTDNKTIPTHTAKGHQTKTSSTVIDRVPDTTAPAEVPPVTAAKPAVVKPKPASQPTQPTVEHEQSAFEKAEALARASTFEIRSQDKTTNISAYGDTAKNCSTTHIGGGLVIFNRHCISNAQFGSDGPKQGGPYDIASSSPDKFTIWNGSGAAHMANKGELKSIVVSGDNSEPDFALGYAPEAANMPSMKLAKQAPNTAGEYFITGYPSAAHGEQKQYPAKFLAEGTVGDIRYKGDPYPTDNNVRLYYFGIDKSVPNAEDACTGGMSGSGPGNTAGEVYGGLIGYGKPPEPGRNGDPIWYGANMHNSADTANMQVVCAYQVVDQALVDSYQAKIGQSTP